MVCRARPSTGKAKQRLLPNETPLYERHPRYNQHNGWTVWEASSCHRWERRHGASTLYTHWYITVTHPQRRRLMLALPRFIVECVHGRELGSDQRVRCVDGNTDNHIPSNYDLIRRVQGAL